MSEKPLHPTARKLRDTVLALLETEQPHEITVEQVLGASGVSIGSLYHHYRDFPNLIDHALTERYAEFARVQIGGLARAVENARDVHEYERNLHELIGRTHAREVAPIRIARANIVAQAAVRPGLRELLTDEQNRLTDGIEATVARAQQLGWVREGMDARVIATFVQAYSIGRIVDDIADPAVDNEKWISLVRSVISGWLAL